MRPYAASLTAALFLFSCQGVHVTSDPPTRRKPSQRVSQQQTQTLPQNVTRNTSRAPMALAKPVDTARRKPQRTSPLEENFSQLNPLEVIARRYSLKNTPWDAVSSIVRSQLSPEGRATYIHSMNCALVVDVPAGHIKAAALFKGMIRDAVNIRVNVNVHKDRVLEKSGFSIHHSGIRISDGKVHGPRHVGINISDRRESMHQNTAQFITVFSGHSAKIWSTRSVVDPQFFRSWSFLPFLRSSYSSGEAVRFSVPMREVGASLWVHPVYSDDGTVTVKLIPVISSIDGRGRHKYYRADGIETTVTTEPGRTVHLGGLNKQTSRFFSSLFPAISSGSYRASDLVDISVTTSIQKNRTPRR